MMDINENILVLAAHPDDEVLGCGGTITRLTNNMENVYVAILGEGVSSRYVKREQADKSVLETLRNDSKRVAELLGVKELFLYDLPDNRFDTIPLLDIVKIIEALVDKIKPSTIFTHHGGDLNIDHSIMHRATLTATRPIARCPVKKIYAYEVPSSTEWAFGQFTMGFQTNYFVDIRGTLEKKIEAMEIYETEARAFPHPRSPGALEVLAKRWGSVVGLEAAEAFELIREIK
jgi:LmbE family N-acetylglucosaminyl deacetylase